MDLDKKTGEWAAWSLRHMFDIANARADDEWLAKCTLPTLFEPQTASSVAMQEADPEPHEVKNSAVLVYERCLLDINTFQTVAAAKGLNIQAIEILSGKDTWTFYKFDMSTRTLWLRRSGVDYEEAMAAHGLFDVRSSREPAATAWPWNWKTTSFCRASPCVLEEDQHIFLSRVLRLLNVFISQH